MAKPAAPAKSQRFTAVAAPARAAGRSLSDFGALSKAEKSLLDHCRAGTLAPIGATRPEKDAIANRVRANFVRFLALGGDEAAPVHEHGVQLQGAWLVGPLELRAATIEIPLRLLRCRIEKIDIDFATLAAVTLDGSHISGIFAANGLRARGTLAIRNCKIARGMQLTGGAISGSLDLSGSRLESTDGVALFGDGMEVSGGVLLRREFHATGEVRLISATIHGPLDCTKGIFENPEKRALSCDGAKISGGVYLIDGFRTVGELSLAGVVVSGPIRCDHGHFENPNGTALRCLEAQVSGYFVFTTVNWKAGDIDLSSMHVADLCDDDGSWTCEKGHLILDGLTYSRLAGEAPVDAPTRVAWLCRQSDAHLGNRFRPQPWEQLIVVLKQMGHLEAAKAIAIAKHEKMRAARRYVGGSRLWDWVYGNLVGYGYRPWKLLRIAFGIWLFCMLAYWAAVRPTAMGTGVYYLGPPRTEHSSPCLVQPTAVRSALPCPAQPPRYQDFFAPTYSLEVMLPVISLGGKERWQPVVSDGNGNPLVMGHMLRILYWLETAFGWLAGLLLVGVVGTLIKKD